MPDCHPGGVVGDHGAMREHIIAALRERGISAQPFGDAYIVAGEHGKNHVLRVAERNSDPGSLEWHGSVKVVLSISAAIDLFRRR